MVPRSSCAHTARGAGASNHRRGLLTGWPSIVGAPVLTTSPQPRATPHGATQGFSVGMRAPALITEHAGRRVHPVAARRGSEGAVGSQQSRSG